MRLISFMGFLPLTVGVSASANASVVGTVTRAWRCAQITGKIIVTVVCAAGACTVALRDAVTVGGSIDVVASAVGA
jgi:predicted secreted protein